MKDEITITQKQFHEAVGKAMDDLIDKSKKQNNSAIATSLSGMLYSIFAAELFMMLFRDDEEQLEIDEHNL